MRLKELQCLETHFVLCFNPGALTCDWVFWSHMTNHHYSGAGVRT